MPDKPANSPAGPQEGTRTTAGAAAGTCGLRVPSAPYQSTVQAGRWFFGLTIRRFSFFVAWKCDETMKNYAREVMKA